MQDKDTIHRAEMTHEAPHDSIMALAKVLEANPNITLYAYDRHLVPSDIDDIASLQSMQSTHDVFDCIDGILTVLVNNVLAIREARNIPLDSISTLYYNAPANELIVKFYYGEHV